MKCPRCEQENLPQAKFCLACGASVGVVAATGGSYAELKAEVASLKRSLTEASEQQAATADILRIISTSPTNLQLVLDAVVKNAARFCGAPDASVFRLDGDTLRAAAHHGPIAQPADSVVPVVRGSVAGRSVLERRVVGVTDLQVETREFPGASVMARQTGQRATLSVPLLREGAPIGVILLRRGEAVPFTDEQIAVLRTFAAQAVIAIENVRLSTELQTSHRNVTTALEQQTATAEVLKVISRSTFDLQPVLQTLVENATKLCGATRGHIFRFDGAVLRFAASYGATAEFVD